MLFINKLWRGWISLRLFGSELKVIIWFTSLLKWTLSTRLVKFIWHILLYQTTGKVNSSMKTNSFGAKSGKSIFWKTMKVIMFVLLCCHLCGYDQERKWDWMIDTLIKFVSICLLVQLFMHSLTETLLGCIGILKPVSKCIDQPYRFTET